MRVVRMAPANRSAAFRGALELAALAFALACGFQVRLLTTELRSTRLMSTYDQRVDRYVAQSAEFARPILKHLRELVHQACPNIQETIKWSFPHFDYKGIVCSMASFKHHCAFRFWKAKLMKDADKLADETAMGSLGRITQLDDLPPDSVLIRYIKEAAKLNESGVKLPAKSRDPAAKQLHVPDYIAKALRPYPKANDVFQNFSFSHKKEYVEWITEAKAEETRNRRIAKMIEWLSQGKSRHWKYERN